MNCDNCAKGFDLKERIPWILLCGHSICQICTGKDDCVACSKCATVSDRALTYDHYRIGLLFTSGHAPVKLKSNRNLLQETLFCQEHPKSVVHYVDEEDSSFHCTQCIRDNDLDEGTISPIEAVNQSSFSELSEMVSTIKAYKENLFKASQNTKAPKFNDTVNKEFLDAHTLLQVKRVKTLLTIMEQNPVMRVCDEIIASSEFMQSCGGLPESGYAAKLLDLAKHTLPNLNEDPKSPGSELPFVDIKISQPEINVNHNLHNFYFSHSNKANHAVKTGDEIKILNFDSPSAIFVRKVKDGHTTASISNSFSDRIAPGGLSYVKEGNMYCVKGPDGIWLRVIVLNYRSDMPEVRVAFIDMGDVKFVPIDNLRCFVETKAVASIPPRVFKVALSATRNNRYRKEQLQQFRILTTSSNKTYWLDHIEGEDEHEFDFLYIGNNGCLNSLRDVCIQEKIISYKSGYVEEDRQMPKKRIHWNEIDIPSLEVPKAAAPMIPPLMHQGKKNNQFNPKLKKDFKNNSNTKLNKTRGTRKKKAAEAERCSSRNSNASSVSGKGSVCTFKI